MHVLTASQNFGNFMSKYLNDSSKQHKCMCSACLHGTDLLGKKHIVYSLYCKYAETQGTMLLVNNTYSFFKYWTRALLDENLLASVSPLFSIQMKKT